LNSLFKSAFSVINGILIFAILCYLSDLFLKKL
jgi:hypothetical protein